MQNEIKKTKVIFESDGRVIVKSRTYKHKPLKVPFGKYKRRIHGQYYWAEFVEIGSFYDLEKCIWEKVDSSVVDYIYYDFDKRYLFVLFKSTREYAYCYLGIGNNEYMKFINAESKGTYLSQYIKPDYRCLKFDFYREEGWSADIDPGMDEMTEIDMLFN